MKSINNFILCSRKKCDLTIHVGHSEIYIKYKIMSNSLKRLFKVVSIIALTVMQTE